MESFSTFTGPKDQEAFLQQTGLMQEFNSIAEGLLDGTFRTDAFLMYHSLLLAETEVATCQNAIFTMSQASIPLNQFTLMMIESDLRQAESLRTQLDVIVITHAAEDYTYLQTISALKNIKARTLDACKSFYKGSSNIENLDKLASIFKYLQDWVISNSDNGELLNFGKNE